VTDAELEQRISDLRRLAGAQEISIARRLGADEPVPTSDINGLAQLTMRLDTLERILEHRRSLSLPNEKKPAGRDARGRFAKA
jgi:hypothetical protein